MTDAADVERQRQAMLPQAQQKPLLHKLIDAVITGDGFDGNVELLYACALLEQIVLAGPQGLYDAEPELIAGYPGMVAAYRDFLDPDIYGGIVAAYRRLLEEPEPRGDGGRGPTDG